MRSDGLESIRAAMDAALNDVPISDILDGVVTVLEFFISRSEKESGWSQKRSEVDQEHICVDIRAFLDHIVSCGLCSKECFIIALIYVERILQKVEGFQITRRNVHSLILVNLMLASKMLDDFYCRNKYYANSGGISLELINDFEVKICFMLNFDFNVSVKEFELYRSSLRQSETTPSLPLSPPPKGSVIYDIWGKSIGIQMPVLTTPQAYLGTEVGKIQPIVDVGPPVAASQQPVQQVVYAPPIPAYPTAVQIPHQQDPPTQQAAVHVSTHSVPVPTMNYYPDGKAQPHQHHHQHSQAVTLQQAPHGQTQNCWFFSPLVVATPPMQVLPSRDTQICQILPSFGSAPAAVDWSAVSTRESRHQPSHISAPTLMESTVPRIGTHVPIRISSFNGRPKPAGKSQKPVSSLSLPSAYQTMFPTLVDNLLPSTIPAWLLA